MDRLTIQWGVGRQRAGTILSKHTAPVDTAARGKQGMEKAAILLSLTVSRAGAFAADAQRLNVALTRARHHLFIVGAAPVAQARPLHTAVRDGPSCTCLLLHFPPCNRADMRLVEGSLHGLQPYSCSGILCAHAPQAIAPALRACLAAARARPGGFIPAGRPLVLPRVAGVLGCQASTAGSPGSGPGCGGSAEDCCTGGNAADIVEDAGAGAARDAVDGRPEAHGEPDNGASSVAEAPGEGHDIAGEGMDLADENLSTGGSGNAAAAQDDSGHLSDASMGPGDEDDDGTGGALASASAACDICAPMPSTGSPAAAAACAWHAGRKAGSLPGSPARGGSSPGGRSPPASDPSRGSGHAWAGRSPPALGCRHAAPPAEAPKCPAPPGAPAPPASKTGARARPESACPVAVPSFAGSGTATRLPLAPRSAGDGKGGQGVGSTGDLGAAHMQARPHSSPEHAHMVVGLPAPSRRAGARCFDLGV